MPYIGTDLTASVQDDLKDPSFSATRILRYLNHAQSLIANTHMFKFWEKSVSGTLTIGSYAYDQQPDHQATIGGSVSFGNSQIFKLNSDTYLPSREFFELHIDPSLNAIGLPSAWTEYGNEIVFDRTPDKSYTIKQRYYRQPTIITGSTVPDVPESFRELLELYAVSKAEKYRGNHDVAATYKQDFEDGLENMNLRYSLATQTGPVSMPSNRMYVELT